MSLARLQLLLKGLGLLSTLCLLVYIGTIPFIPKNHPISQAPTQQSTDVLGIATIPTPTPVLVLSKDMIASSTPTPLPVIVQPHTGTPTKEKYTIAIYGDTMDDALGNRLELLSSLLTQLYPTTHFSLYNYGKSDETAQEALTQFDTVFTYRGRNYPAITEIHPDIIILGSFAYEVSKGASLEGHKLLLHQLLNKAQATGAKVFLLAEIAPLGTDFGKGSPEFSYFTDEMRLSYAKGIVDQLSTVFSLSAETATPVIDMYNKTTSNGPFGSWQYTSKDDGILPSVYGQSITADAIAHSLF